MISVKFDQSGYKVSVSDSGLGRYYIRAATREEAVNAIAHYLGTSYGHDPGICPTCDRIRKEQAAEGRKRK